EALQAVEPHGKKCTDEQLHAAITEYRSALERRRDAEHYLRDYLQDTLSECFETGYEQLSSALNKLKVTAAMDLAEERQQWPDEAKDPQKATLSLLKEIEPALKDIDDDVGRDKSGPYAEAFVTAWPHFEEARRNAANPDDETDERLEQF